MSPSLFWKAFKKEVLYFHSLISLSIISFLYFSFSTLILNYKLVFQTLFVEYEIQYKLKILYLLIIGSWTAFSRVDFFLLVFTSFLVGINILLVIKIIKRLKFQGTKASISIGGSSILALTTAGCSSCGFSILSIMGLTSSLSLMPLRGTGLNLVSISLLVISIFFSIRTMYYSGVCKITYN